MEAARNALDAPKAPAVSPAVDALLDELDLGSGDPRAVLGVLLRVVAGTLDESPSVGLVRELRLLLGQLAGMDGPAAGEVDPARVAALRKRVLEVVS